MAPFNAELKIRYPVLKRCWGVSEIMNPSCRLRLLLGVAVGLAREILTQSSSGPCDMSETKGSPMRRVVCVASGGLDGENAFV